MMRVFVTGAAGFIGSSVCEALLDRGDEVVGLDNFDPFYARAFKETNLKQLDERPGFAFHEGDILNAAQVERLLGGAEAMVHLAALAGVRPSIERPAAYMKTNVEGTARLLQSCCHHDVKRLVVASSSSVYGSRSETPFRESDPCDRPASPYAASKKATELICSTFSELHGLGISCLRYFTVYGPRQRPEMAIHKFVRRALTGRTIPMFGDGSSGRDYTYIDDIVAGTLAALDHVEAGQFRVYNLGGTQPVTLRELIAAIERAAGTTIDIEQKPWQAGDVPITSADVSCAAEDFGYAPSVDLEEGLRRFVAWYREMIE